VTTREALLLPTVGTVFARGVVGLLAVLAAAPLHAQTSYNESFEGGVNAGGWTLDASAQSIPATGGYPGAFFRASMLNAGVPLLHTGAGVNSPFIGDYRAARIAKMRVYLKVFAAEVPVTNRVASLILANDNGTPADPQDDWGAYMLHSPLPPTGLWSGYVWHVQSDLTALPSGWSMIDLGPNPPANRSWNVLIQDVDRVFFSFGNPSTAYPAQVWDVGADEIMVQPVYGCIPNCDRSTVPPCLNVNDFQCFINQFALGANYANCDNSTVMPILNVNDFTCFLGVYGAGCVAACQ
jgi:hypothetical protein